MSVASETGHKSLGRPRKAPTPSPAMEKAARIAVFNRTAIRLKSLGDGTRLQILDALSRSELNVKEIRTLVGLSQAAISHHLAIFRLGEIVECHRQGKTNIYSLTDRGRLLVSMAEKAMDESV